MTLTKEILEQLKQASEKATKAPWSPCIAFHEEPDCSYSTLFADGINPASTDDFKFIALARNQIDSLIERVEELEALRTYALESLIAENETMKSLVEHLEKQAMIDETTAMKDFIEVTKINTENMRLRDEAAKMRECIEFYANPDKWQTPSSQFQFDEDDCGLADMIDDDSESSGYGGSGGKRARECLASLEVKK